MVPPRSIFLKYNGDEAQLALTFGQIVGQPLFTERPDVGPVHRCKVLDVELALFSDHGLEDIPGIAFSTYNYQAMLTAFDVGLRIPAYAEMYESMSLFLAARLSAELRCETLVVENLEHEIASYRP